MLLDKLRSEGVLKGSKIGEECLAEMEILFNYLQDFDCLDNIVFDLSLARGLDYYTGIIFEAVLVGGTNLGSIAGGGRYDQLVGMFSSKDIPAVGFSVGIERLFSILEEKANNVRCSQTEVFVVSIGNNLVRNRLALCAKLWKNNIKAETSYVENPKLPKQITNALEDGIPFLLFIGENEVKQGKVKLKVSTSIFCYHNIL